MLDDDGLVGPPDDRRPEATDVEEKLQLVEATDGRVGPDGHVDGAFRSGEHHPLACGASPRSLRAQARGAAVGPKREAQLDGAATHRAVFDERALAAR